MNQTILLFFYNFVQDHIWLLHICQFFAAYGIFLIPLTLLILFFFFPFREKRIAGLAFIAIVISWLVLSKAISHFYPIARPALPPLNWSDPLFHHPETSFPSDHTAAIFAMTFMFFSFKLNKLAIWFLIFSIIISFSRIALALHWPADVLGGIIIGFISAVIVWYLRNIFYRLINPIINLIFKPKVS